MYHSSHGQIPHFRDESGVEMVYTECVLPHCSAPVNDHSKMPLCWTCLIEAWRVVDRLARTADVSRHDEGEEYPSALAGNATAAWSAPGVVYFIRLGDRIKVGFSRNLSTRLRALPHEEVLRVVAGSRRDEGRIHAAFDHRRVTGEWFEAATDLIEFIADLADKDVRPLSLGARRATQDAP